MMGMPVAELQERMSSREFTEWKVFLELEKGHLPAHRAGVLASLLANIHRDHKRHPNPYRPEDFFPELRDDHTPTVGGLKLNTAEDAEALIARQRAQAKFITQLFRQAGSARNR